MAVHIISFIGKILSGIQQKEQEIICCVTNALPTKVIWLLSE
jgi:hypothetical protein